MEWVKIINIGTGVEVKTQGLLRSDGRWTMWEVVSGRPAYLGEMRVYLLGQALGPEQQHNAGGQEEFERFFERERVRRGLVYMSPESGLEGWK